jgi:hypothetical protein
MFAIALGWTVLLMVTTAYFILGSVPLLVLKHDTPLDARFVRGFFDIYYVAAFVTATATAISFALAGYPAIGAGAAVLALMAIGLRKKIIPKMELLGAQIQLGALESVPGFRRIHLFAIVMNLAQMVAIVGCLISVSRSQMPPTTVAAAAMPAAHTAAVKQP